MADPEVRSPWARLFFAVLGCVWSATGWYMAYDGGFTRTTRWATSQVRVDGGLGLLMAYILMLLGISAFAVLLQSWRAGAWAYIGCAALVLLPPTLYLLGA